MILEHVVIGPSVLSQLLIKYLNLMEYFVKQIVPNISSDSPVLQRSVNLEGDQ